MKIGFDTRNFVARASRYDGIPDLAHHEAETQRRFSIPSMSNWLDMVADIGFDGLSVWTSHCWYPTASRQQIEAIRDLGAGVGLPIYALNGRLGEPNPNQRLAWERTVAAGTTLGAELLVGQPDAVGRGFLGSLARSKRFVAYRTCLEEKSILDMAARIDRSESWMGLSLDVGIATLYRIDVPEAIRVLRKNLVEIYLRDLRGSELGSVALGDGDIDLKGIIGSLRAIGYEGWLTVGHTPYDRDPLPEIETSVQRLQDLLGI